MMKQIIHIKSPVTKKVFIYKFNLQEPYISLFKNHRSDVFFKLLLLLLLLFVAYVIHFILFYFEAILDDSHYCDTCDSIWNN